MDENIFFFVLCGYFYLNRNLEHELVHIPNIKKEYTFLQIRAAIEPTVEQLNRINLEEIISGPPISRDLNARLINCLGNNKTANCPSGSIPISESLRRLLALNRLAEPNVPVNAPVTATENTRRTLIPNLLSNNQERVMGRVEQAPTKAIGLLATLPGAENRARALVALAGDIITETRKPDHQDPIQDISKYVKTKNLANVKYNAGKVVKNKQKLADTFSRTNVGTVRRFGANYDKRVPNVLIMGILKTFVHL